MVKFTALLRCSIYYNLMTYEITENFNNQLGGAQTLLYEAIKFH